MATATQDARWRTSPEQVPTAQPPQEEEREAGAFDSWYSALISFVFHFCLVMFMAFLATVATQQDALPVAVETVAVTDSTSVPGEADDDIPAGEVAESMDSSDEASDVPLPETPASQEIEAVEVDIPDLPDTADQQTLITEQAAKSRAAAAAAKSAAKNLLDKNLGGSPGTPGGGGGSGRAGRAARWVMNIKFSSVDNYLEQLGGLGAEVAFPQRGNTYLYFTDLAGSRGSQSKDISDESRIYWMNESRQAAQQVAAALGQPNPEFLVIFLPEPLEAKMLKQELAYQNAPSEESIVQTIFEVVTRGASYDVIVVDQTLANE